jgi:hypothetical protein
MISGDYYVTMYKGNDLNEIPMRVHLWLENMTRIDLGNYSLRIFHTPGPHLGMHLDYRNYVRLAFLGGQRLAGGTLHTSPSREASLQGAVSRNDPLR